MHLNSIREKLLFGVLRWLPLHRDSVVFKSFGGQYADNPRYISEAIHELSPDIKLIWAVSDKSSGIDFPEYVKQVRIDSLPYIYYCSVSKVLVDNMSGIRGIRNNKKCGFLYYFLKRKGQLNVSTWHGTPLKKIGCDVKEDHISNYQTSSDFLTVGNQYSFEVFQKAFRGIPIRGYGSPRNDLLCRKDCDTERLRRKLGIPERKKVMLYAPTYRKSEEESGVVQIRSLSLKKLFRVLQDKFGGDWCLVIRVHHEVIRKIHEQFAGMIDGETVIDGNQHDDMAEYLAVADALLTDYSSSMFDYMLTEKPCFLMAFDREEYVNDERGVYFPISDLPYHFADTVDQLYEDIACYDHRKTAEEVRLFLNRLGEFSRPDTAKKLARGIIQYMDRYRGK